MLKTKIIQFNHKKIVSFFFKFHRVLNQHFGVNQHFFSSFFSPFCIERKWKLAKQEKMVKKFVKIISRPTKLVDSNLSFVKIYNSHVYFDFRLNWSPRNMVQNGALINHGQDHDQDQVQDQHKPRKIFVRQRHQICWLATLLGRVGW